jgi:acyl-CoA thioester hydrolase
MQEAPITYRGTVYPWHCDHMGHMNVMWYVGKFDEATWHLLALVGLSPSYLREANRGMVAVEQRVSYKREVLAGSVVLVRSQFLEVREKVLRFAHEMVDVESSEVAAVTELTGVHIDRGTRKSCPLPTVVQERVMALMAPP